MPKNPSRGRDIPVLQPQEPCDFWGVSCMGSKWCDTLTNRHTRNVLGRSSKSDVLETSYIDTQFLHPYFLRILLKGVRCEIHGHSLGFSTFCVHISLFIAHRPADVLPLVSTTPALSQTTTKPKSSFCLQTALWPQLNGSRNGLLEASYNI